MSIKANLTGTGIPPAAAAAIVGGWISTEAGAGTTQAGATLLSLVTHHRILTAANNSGVILPPGNGSADGMGAGDSITVWNYDANTLIVYPPLGGKINNGTLNAGVNLTTLKGGEFFSIDGLNFTALLSA